MHEAGIIPSKLAAGRSGPKCNVGGDLGTLPLGVSESKKHETNPIHEDVHIA
jgi:hypothetical protein